MSLVDTYLVHKMTDIDEAKIERLSQRIPAMTTVQAESLGNYITAQIKKIIEEKA